MKRLMAFILVLCLVIGHCSMMPLVYEVSAQSEAAVLMITQQPSNQTVKENENAVFHVQASGEGLTYQWYVKTSPTKNWQVTKVAGTGYDTDTFTIAATKARNGFQYKCAVTDKSGKLEESHAAAIVIGENIADSITITKHPSDQMVSSGTSAVFTAGASGDGLTYQWYVRTSATTGWTMTRMAGSGFDTDTLTIQAEKSRDGFQYKCAVIDENGYIKETESAALYIRELHPMAVSIVGQPENQMVDLGENAIFSVVAEGDGLTYQWYVKTSPSSTWQATKMSGTGYDTDTLTIQATKARYGFQYKCSVTDQYGNTEESSIAALLPKESEPAALNIIRQPSDQAVPEKDYAVFSMEAKGDGLVYQWYVKTSTSANWTATRMPDTGYDTNILRIQATKARDGFLYKCIVTNSKGYVQETNAVSLTISNPEPLVITRHPQTQLVELKETATFSVTATGVGLTYQWYVKTSPTGDWTMTRMSGTGYDTNTLKIQATAARIGFQYMCVVTDKYGNTAASESASLLKKEPQPSAMQITQQPQSQSVKLLDTAIFKTVVSGENLVYQWYVRGPGDTVWTATRMPNTGFDTPELHIQATKARDGFQYKCVVTDEKGYTLETAVVTLTVKKPQPLLIVAQPTTKTLKSGEYAVFTVKAAGDTLTYQWYVKMSATANWTATRMPGTGYDTDTLSVQATPNRNGFQYKCVIKDANGNTLETDIVSLNIAAKPVIAQQPADVTGYIGEAAVITVEASGENLSYDWQTSSDGKNWNSVGETSTEYHFTITNEAGLYRCVITDSYGQQVISDTAQVIAKADDYALPTNLSFTQNGTVSFRVVEPQAHTIMLGLYRQELMTSVSARMEGETVDPVASTLVTVLSVRLKAGTDSYSINVSNLFDISAEYYVTLKAVENASIANAHDLGIGHTITSNTVYFLRPEQSLETPADIHWSDESYGRAEWDAVEGAVSYQVMLYAGDNIVASRNINTTFFDFSTGWIDIGKITENSYTFTVTAMSSDITAISNSAESVHSAVLGEPDSTEPVSIVTQPASKYASLNSNLTTNLKAEGIGLTYDWYVDGVLAAEELDNASFNLDASREGSISVYAVVHDAFGNTVTSDTAVITVVDDRAREHVITAQPADVTIDAGQTAYFGVDVEAIPHFDVDYHWYVSFDNGESWEDWFDTDRWASVSGDVDRSGTKYRCEVRVTAPTGVVVCTEMSEAAALTVNPLPIVITFDLDNRYFTGSTQSVTVLATGENLAYTWYYKTDAMEDFAVYENVSRNRLVIEDIQVATVIYCVVHNDEASVQSRRATVYPGNNPASDISIYQYSGPNASHLAVGDSVGLTYSLTPGDSDSRVTWRSDNESVVSVSYGTVTAKAFGTANISATANGHTATFPVTVDSYRIEYNPEGGVFADGSTSNKVIRTVKDTALTLPVVSKADDTFLGWTTDGETVVTEMTASADTTLFAKWEASTQQEDKALAIEQDLQPNQYARIGTNALFEVVTNGAKVRSYCWMVNDGSGWMPIYNGITNDGAKTSLEVAASEDNNGYSYKVVITAFRDDAVVESAVATLTTGETDTPPQTETKFHFTAQPQNTAVTEGENATFTVAVDAETASYQWQCRSGSDWVDVEGATGTELILTETTLAMNAKEYRCQVTVNEKTQSSAVAVLTVNEKKVITIRRNLAADYYPGSEGFRIEADGIDLRFQWYAKVSGAAAFTAVEGATGSTYAPVLTASDDGLQVYCHIIDAGVTPSIEKDSAIATFNWVIHANSVTVEKESGEESLIVGDTLVLKATTEPKDVTDSVLWETSDASVATVSEGIVTITGLGNATIYAVVGEQRSSYSITVDHVQVTYDPNGGYLQETTVRAVLGEFTPEAVPTQDGMTFAGWSLNGIDVETSVNLAFNVTLVAVWEQPSVPYNVTYDANGGHFEDNTFTKTVEVPSGAYTPEFTPEYSNHTFLGWRLNGEMVSDSIDITENVTLVAEWEDNLPIEDNPNNLVFIEQPQDIYEVAGQIAALSVSMGFESQDGVQAASDEDKAAMTYRWQTYTDNAWVDIEGISGSSYSVTVSADMDGIQYRVIVGFGNQETASSAATLHVVAKKLTVTSSFNESICVREYEEVYLYVDSNIWNSNYQWHEITPEGADTILSSTSWSYSFRPTAAQNGCRYYCVVTSGGQTMQSKTATISVEALSEAPSSVTISADRDWISMDVSMPMSEIITITSQIEGLSSTENLVYWWEYSEDNDYWYQISDAWGEDNVNEVHYDFMPTMDGYVYFRLNVNGIESNILEISVSLYDTGGPYGFECPCGPDCGCGMGSECTCGMDGTMMMSANRMTMSLASETLSEQNAAIQSAETYSTDAVESNEEDTSTEAVDTIKEDTSTETVDTIKEDASTEAVDTTKEDASTAETTAIHTENDTHTGTVISDSDVK